MLSIDQFLLVATPQAWIEHALTEQETLLIDHAHCEKKAASNALSLIYRYVDKPELLQKVSRLAREEMRHFEKVLSIMQERGIAYTHMEPSRYAQQLQQYRRNHEPVRLVDTLLIGAFIEARSCERFRAIAPYLDKELSEFYHGLYAAEERHFLLYLNLAKHHSVEPLEERIQFFAEKEAELVVTHDPVFRFHSGLPV